jgi:hypothetical protein
MFPFSTTSRAAREGQQKHVSKKKQFANCLFGRVDIISKKFLFPSAVIMKILEAQSAVLTNYEVYSHLVQQEERYGRKKKNWKGRKHSDRRPGNLATLSIEVQIIYVGLIPRLIVNCSSASRVPSCTSIASWIKALAIQPRHYQKAP